MFDFEMGLGVFVVLLGLTAAFTALGLLMHLFLQSARRERRRSDALRSHERILLERMDVLKTAIAVGFNDTQLDELDLRLEKLIGSDRLSALLAGEPGPAVPRQLSGQDFETEVERLALQKRSQSSG